jgi:xanthine dehydrogenase YagS FAD-binding subunit
MIDEFLDFKVIDETLALVNEYWGTSKHFEHFNARTIDEAVSILSNNEEARIIAGGVDLMTLMKNSVIMPQLVVNIKTIPKLAYIAETAYGLRLGPLTTITSIETSPVIRNRYGLLTESAHSVAAPTVRNMATIAGNLCQEVRCWYYRRSPITGTSFFCYRKGGERCYAASGENKYHAIIGNKKCRAVCPSDMATALLALDARLKIVGPAGERIISLEEFYSPLGNTLRLGEMITEIHVPAPKPSTSQQYLKFRERKAVDFAITSVAAMVTSEDAVVTNARIVLGGVTSVPFRALKAEEMLRGEVITESLAEKAGMLALSEARPLSKNTYKIPISKALVARAILKCK